ncbi:class I SAM-dependent methyltransferase [Ekhidna sp.]|uniref:class I SAM-dependent methyltransferase n=1 Tax=Ekhidna sp. TaxID=2608089 RepID=UPI003BAC60FA
MKAHKKCLVCDSPKLKTLSEQYEKKGLVKCGRCGFVFMKQIPSIEELSKFYSSYSYASKGYLPPLTRISYNKLLDQFEKHRKHNTILDVGAGRGWFLDEAKNRGWKVYATEFSETAVESMRMNGIQVEEGALNETMFRDVTFDVVTSFEVIEHINNPQEELQIIGKLLRKGGLFYCTTPNYNSIMRYYLGASYNIINYPEHLSYYTPTTINHLFKKNGFKRKKLITTGISISRINASQGNSKERSTDRGSKDEKLRQVLSGNQFMRRVKTFANFLLSISSLGMTIKAYYINNGH